MREEILAAADPTIADLYSDRFSCRWKRLDAPMRPGADLFALLEPTDQRIKRVRWKRIKDIFVDVVGVIFPEEVSWRASGTGWAFVVLLRQNLKRGREASSALLVRANRTGRSDLIARVPELAPLRGKKIALIGVGGVGAPSAIELAKSGIGELRILDGDYVEAGTTVRYPLGLAAVGFSKAEILAEFIEANWPYTKTKPYAHVIGAVQRI